MCLVLGRYLGLLASSLAPSLSSNIVHLTVDCGFGSCNTGANSSRSSLNGIISRVYCESAMYSASVVLKAISVCNFDFQMTGQPL